MAKNKNKKPQAKSIQKTTSKLGISLGFIGTGKMATALIKSILSSKLLTSQDIFCSDVKKENLDAAHLQFNINLSDNLGVCSQADIIFLCVKPQDMVELLKEISKETKNKLVVSIAAGITIATLEQHLPNARIIRVMPNTPCLVGEMAAVYSLGKKATPQDQSTLLQLLAAGGKAFELKEELIASATAVSGCGPAFFAYFIKYIAEAGVKKGLKKEIAYKLAAKTALGTGKLLLEMKITPDELIEMVASKKGTTEAGLKVLNKYKVKKILEKTVDAAYKRSRELGK